MPANLSRAASIISALPRARARDAELKPRLVQEALAEQPGQLRVTELGLPRASRPRLCAAIFAAEGFAKTVTYLTTVVRVGEACDVRRSGVSLTLGQPQRRTEGLTLLRYFRRAFFSHARAGRSAKGWGGPARTPTHPSGRQPAPAGQSAYALFSAFFIMIFMILTLVLFI